MISLLILGLFCLFFIFRVPVAVTMIMVSLVTLLVIGQIPLVVIPQYIVVGMTKFELLAVPFFILAGEIMNAGGLTERIFRFALVAAGWMPGALAQVNVVASVIFAGISGTAVADAAGLGRVEIAAMRKAGYDPGFASAVTLASCIIGPLVPPSVVMVIYAVTTEISVGRMLLAGAVPGLLLAAVLMVYIYWLVRTGRVVCPSVPTPRGRELLRVVGEGVPAVVAPFVILLGIVFGVFTPTEAGVAACVYSLLVAVLVYRELTWRSFAQVMVRATLSTAMIMFVIGTATVMSWIITWDRSAVAVASWMSSLSHLAWVQLLLINIFLLFVGCLIEGVPAMLLLIPVLLPVATSLGVDPIQFGVILVFNLLVGIITPPMGIGLYIMSNITGLTVEQVAKACVPFLVPLLITLGLITYVPQVSVYLPRLLMH